MKILHKWAKHLLVMALMTGISAGMFYGKGAPPAVTHAPAEGSCQAGRCHTQYPLNSGSGTLNLTGIPSGYRAGEKYILTISLVQEGQARWGFQITALDGNDHPAGELLLLDTQFTQLKTEVMPDMSERQYIGHTVEGTYPGIKNGPVTWEIIWQAPRKDTGPVFFYTAANAANFNKRPWGDYIYTRVDTVFGSPSN